VVVMDARWNAAWYSQFGGVLGHEMTFVTGTMATLHEKEYQSSFTVDPASLRRVLEGHASSERVR
jgi:hypothetical protein